MEKGPKELVLEEIAATIESSKACKYQADFRHQGYRYFDS